MADVFCLSTHATYRCRHSGACCSSRWAIPVEAPLYRRLTAALADGTLRRADVRSDADTTSGDPASNEQGHDEQRHGEQGRDAPFVTLAESSVLPREFAAVLRTRADGTCAFFDRSSRLCDVHRDKGHDWLPASCRQFPRVSLLDRRGIFVTLSHYCPTAAGLLFDDDSPIAIVANAPAFPRDGEYDGLDARDQLPPLLRPGVLMDWATLAAWDRFAFARLDRETDEVDAALRDLQFAAEHLRRWKADEGPLTSRMAEAARVALSRADAREGRRAWGLDRAVRACVPPSAAPLAEMHHALTADECVALSARWIDPVWPAFTRPLCRYVAAKLCGNWCWYQGDGLRTVLQSVEAALAVVRVEAARHVQRHGRMLDRGLLRDSVRQADLLLVHLASRDALARQWSTAEAHAPE